MENKGLTNHLTEMMGARISNYNFNTSDAQDATGNRFQQKITFFIAAIHRSFHFYYELFRVVQEYYLSKGFSVDAHKKSSDPASKYLPEHFVLIGGKNNQVVELLAQKVGSVIPKQVIFVIIEKDLIGEK